MTTFNDYVVLITPFACVAVAAAIVAFAWLTMKDPS